MILASPLGPVNLSIPLAGGRNTRQLLHEVGIDHSRPWQQQHLKTIMNYYNRSPWFEFYRAELEQLYFQPPLLLTEFDRRCVEWVLEKLGLTVKMTEFENAPSPAPNGDFTDWRQRLLPKNYTTVYQELGLPAMPVYNQVYQERTGFLPNLSILDLLFCEGPNAGRVLQQCWQGEVGHGPNG